MLKSLAISSLTGLCLGLALLAWLRPNTSPGAVATVVFTTFVCTLVGSVLQVFRRRA